MFDIVPIVAILSIFIGSPLVVAGSILMGKHLKNRQKELELREREIELHERSLQLAEDQMQLDTLKRFSDNNEDLS